MNKTATAALFTAAAFVMLSGFHGGCGSASPEQRAKRITRMVHDHTEDFLDDVDASEDQRTKVHGLADRVVEQALPLIPEQQRAKQELIAQWKSKSPDGARVHAIIDERIAAATRVVHTAADALLELHRTLTPEQRREIDEKLPSE